MNNQIQRYDRRRDIGQVLVKKRKKEAQKNPSLSNAHSNSKREKKEENIKRRRKLGLVFFKQMLVQQTVMLIYVSTVLCLLQIYKILHERGRLDTLKSFSKVFHPPPLLTQLLTKHLLH